MVSSYHLRSLSLRITPVMTYTGWGGATNNPKYCKTTTIQSSAMTIVLMTYRKTRKEPASYGSIPCHFIGRIYGT